MKKHAAINPVQLVWSVILLSVINSLCAFAAAPTITGFTPASGPVGTSVTITGTNFDATPANNIVFFGAVRATVASGSTTSLTVTVPPGATYKPVTVLSNGLLAYSKKPFVVTFTGGSITTNSFGSKSDFATGVYSTAIALGDLDNDGKVDVAVTNINGGIGVVSVFRNTSTGPGNISYASKIELNAGAVPALQISMGDFDGDGKIDLASVSWSSTGYISVFRNTSSGTGNISFAARVDLPAAYYPNSIAVDDLDGDGRADIAIANVGNSTSSTGNIFVCRNTSSGPGNISFATKVDFPIGSFPESIAIGDVDGDGKPDIATGNRVNTGFVLRNLSPVGSIVLGVSLTFTTGDDPKSVKIGDFDGDGKGDLALVIHNTAKVAIFLNTSSGPGNIAYGPKVLFTSADKPLSISLSDVDGNGKADVAVATQSNVVSLLSNTSSGFGSIDFATRMDFATGVNTQDISIADHDGDGAADIAAVNLDGQNFSILTKSASAVPSITSFTPSAGPIGTMVTITGKNFSTTAANNIVKFNGHTAITVSSSSNSIVTNVPSGATTGKITVTISGNSATSLTDFTVTAPSGAAPVIAPASINIIIGGTAMISLIPLLSDADNNLDLNSLKIISQPNASGATAIIDAEHNLKIDYNGNTFSGKDEIIIEVCDLNGNCAQQVLTVEVRGDIIIYNAVSPSGSNPTFHIQNITALPETKNNTVLIFDRWQNEVWRADNYDNETIVFKGLSKNGNDLPTGIYFYKIAFTSGRKSQTGFLSLKR